MWSVDDQDRDVHDLPELRRHDGMRSQVTRVYTAGKMSGLPHFGIPAFDLAAIRLRAEGLDVVNPAELDDPETRLAALASPDGLHDGTVNGETWSDFIVRDVRVLVDGDIDEVIVLPGWKTSRGARLETFIAHLCDKPIRDYETREIVPMYELLGIWAGWHAENEVDA